MFLRNMRKMIRKIFVYGLLFITVVNETGYIALLPTLWLRNLWSFGIEQKPSITRKDGNSGFGTAELNHALLGQYHFYFEKPDRALFNRK